MALCIILPCFKTLMCCPQLKQHYKQTVSGVTVLKDCYVLKKAFNILNMMYNDKSVIQDI